MEDSRLVSKLESIRKEIEDAQNESNNRHPGVDAYLEMARQNIELALSNLGVPI